ncbi:MAG: carboxymuconolactone decarboxylase family protein [Acidimicrobiales bacterium]
MRLRKPRIEAVTRERLDELRQELFGEESNLGQRVLNVTRLWGVHPALMKAQRGLQTHVFNSTLDPRLRELAILRIGWRCDSGYELAQHAVFGMRAGLDVGDLERVTMGPDEPGWTPLESAVIRAVDEMFEDAFVTTSTWEQLSEELSDQQVIDLLSVVGRYWTVSVVLNSTGVQLEEDTKPFSEYLTA